MICHTAGSNFRLIANLHELRYTSVDQADSISAENLQYKGKNDEGEHVLASEEEVVLDMQI